MGRLGRWWLLGALAAAACGSTAAAGTGDTRDTDDAEETDAESDTDLAVESIHVSVDDHVRECTQTCSNWRMRDQLTLRLQAEESTRVLVEWTSTEIDGVPQVAFDDPIAFAYVDLEAGVERLVELDAQVRQCSPYNAGPSTGRFQVVLEGNTFYDFIVPSRKISVPPPEGC